MFGRRAILPIDVEVSVKTAEESLNIYKDAPDLKTDVIDQLVVNRDGILLEAKANSIGLKKCKKNSMIESMLSLMRFSVA